MLKTGEKFCSALAALPTDKSSYNQAPTVDLRPPVSKLYIVANRSREPHQNLTRCDVHAPNLRLFKAAYRSTRGVRFVDVFPVVKYFSIESAQIRHVTIVVTFCLFGWMEAFDGNSEFTSTTTRRATQMHRLQSCNALREASPSRRAVT